MNCPKCKGGMEQVTFEGVTVDRCAACKGIWFDADEQKLLKSKKGAETIDTGDAATGRQMDKITDINCPRCQVAMIRMVDVDQQAIDYEACTRCFGIFLDAGEFRHLKATSISEYLRGMFATGGGNGAAARGME